MNNVKKKDFNTWKVGMKTSCGKQFYTWTTDKSEIFRCLAGSLDEAIKKRDEWLLRIMS